MRKGYTSIPQYDSVDKSSTCSSDETRHRTEQENAVMMERFKHWFTQWMRSSNNEESLLQEKSYYPQPIRRSSSAVSKVFKVGVLLACLVSTGLFFSRFFMVYNLSSNSKCLFSWSAFFLMIHDLRFLLYFFTD